MYDYVVKELPAVLKENFPQLDTSRASISGHSMGGHGALTIYLKNLDKYKVDVYNFMFSSAFIYFAPKFIFLSCLLHVFSRCQHSRLLQTL